MTAAPHPPMVAQLSRMSDVDGLGSAGGSPARGGMGGGGDGPAGDPVWLARLPCPAALDGALHTVLLDEEPFDYDRGFVLVDALNRIFEDAAAIRRTAPMAAHVCRRIAEVERQSRDLMRQQATVTVTLPSAAAGATGASTGATLGHEAAAATAAAAAAPVAVIMTPVQAVSHGLTALVDELSTIKTKVDQSQKTVTELTQDIKRLDAIKSNLSSTLDLLKKLQFLVSGIQRCERLAANRQYLETSDVLRRVLTEIVPFQSMRAIPQLSALCSTVANLQSALRDQILQDFRITFQGGSVRHRMASLNESCRVMEQLQNGQGKQMLLDWYLTEQMSDYVAMFRTTSDVGGLADVGKRYAWLKRFLKAFDEEQTNMFPTSWNMAQLIVQRFGSETSKHLSDVLKAHDAQMDVKAMLQALQQTIDFEGKLNTRFANSQGQRPRRVDPAATGAGEPVPVPVGPYTRLISAVFDPYLHHYVAEEEKNLQALVATCRAKPLVCEEGGVLTSATDVFYTIRQSLVHCAALSTREPLLLLSDVFRRAIDAYTDFLRSRLPRDGTRPPLSAAELTELGYLLMTTDYGVTVIQQLEDKMKTKLDAAMGAQISFQTERDTMMTANGSAFTALVSAVSAPLEAILQSMARYAWASQEVVGDQSAYVTQVGASLAQSMAVVAPLLHGTKYFRSFCDRFADDLLTRYLAAIYRCRPITPVNAGQLLLDMNMLRAFLTTMTTYGPDGKPAAAASDIRPPNAFVKLVQRHANTIEGTLKVVLRPFSPPEQLVDTYRLLFPDRPSAADFQRILELKGLRRSEQQHCLELFQQQAQPGAEAGEDRVRTGTSRLPGGRDDGATGEAALTGASELANEPEREGEGDRGPTSRFGSDWGRKLLSTTKRF